MCECCGRDNREVHVCCCTMGAASFAYCNECLSNEAELFCLVKGQLDMVGGLCALRPEAIDGMTVFVDGKYVLVTEYFKE